VAGPDAQRAIAEGALFDGRYRVLRRLGGGGMGDVYLAEEELLQRRCALKVLHAEFAQDPAHVDRFLREAKTMARFSHPNIVGIFAYGKDPLGVYFAMELLEGEDLDARVKARAERPYSLAECCAWAIEVARAVAVVHAARLIHRDLKASNIFLARQGGQEVVKLLDFGIARPIEGSELTRTGVSLGTPSYMAPEQILNSPLDHRADVYSFGVLLFKLLTGRVPFTGEAIQVTMQHCMVPPPAPSTVAPEAAIPPALDAIVLKAMAKQAGERHDSMAALEQALLAVVAEIGAGPTGDRASATTPRTRSLTAPSLTPPVDPREAATTQQQSPGRSSPSAARRSGSLQGWLAAAGLSAVTAVAAYLALRDPGVPPAPTTLVPPAAKLSAAPSPPAAVPAPAQPDPTIAADAPVAEAQPDEPLPPLEPETAAAPKLRPKPERPLAATRKKAAACRRRHPELDAVKVTVEYVVGIDGKVTRASASVRGLLADCLVKAVSSTQFGPQPRVQFEEIEL
jgi:serine/threonine protein kinase